MPPYNVLVHLSLDSKLQNPNVKICTEKRTMEVSFPKPKSKPAIAGFIHEGCVNKVKSRSSRMRAKKGRYRLSPNEEAQLLKEETEKRRRLRILQVREQAKQNASKVRNAVRQERQNQIKKLAVELQDQLEKEKDEKVRQLETQYENCLRSIGHGQKDAGDQIDQDEERKLIMEEYNRKADLRGRAAIDKLRSDKIIQEYDENKQKIYRNAALEVERNRAAQIAALPPPPPDPLEQINLPQNQKKLIKTTNADAFSTTYYHMSQDYAVDKADENQQENARLAAEEEQEKIILEQLELKRLHNDRMARARVRHQHALQKEMLKHDYDKMLMDLSDLQRSDRDRRQKVVANIPKQVFEPPYKRIEDREDNQKIMEEAFEDMYMAETNYIGDISLALDPHPPPESSSVGDSLSESGLTEGTPIPEPSLPRIPPVLRDMTNMPRQAAEKSPHKKPEKVLRKLMDKIKSQREEHNSKSVNDIPEQDITNQPTRDDQIPTLSEYTLSEKSSPGDPHQRLKYSPPEKQARVQKDILHIPTGAPTAVQPGAAVYTGKDTLMHPMEAAAHIRQGARKPVDEVYPGQSETKKTVDNIMEQQRQIEEQRRELEEKLKILEQQQRSLSGSLSMTTGTIVTTVPSTGSLPASSMPIHTVGAFPTTSSAMINMGYPSASMPPTSGSVHLSSAGLVAHYSGPSQPQTLPHQFSTGAFQPFTDTNKAFSGPLSVVPNYTKSLEPDVRDYLSPAAKERESPVYTSSLPMKTSWNGVPVSRDDKYNLDLSKVREYQNNLLTKHEHSKQILAQTRVEIERRRQELLKRFPQLDIKPMGTSQFSSTAGLSFSHPGVYQEPDAGLKPGYTTASRSPGKSSVTNLVSSLASDPYYASRLMETKDGKQELAGVSEISKPSTIMPDSVSQPSGTKFDGIRKSLPFDVDDSLQESPFRINGGLVSSARSESEITTESDMSALKDDMDESVISSSTDRGSPALHGRRSGHTSESDSSLLSTARDRKEFFEKRQEDLKKQLREIQKQKDQIVERHKVGQQKLQAQQDMLRDKVLYAQTFNAIDSLSSATNTEDDEYIDDFTSKQHDPSSSKLSIPLYRPTQNLAEHRPHDLSTIQEVDTPRSARKSFGSGRPSLSSNTSSVSRRSLDFNQPSSLIPEERDHESVTPTERRIAGDTGYQSAKIDDIISKAREFNPAVMDKLKKQTNDVFANLNDEHYRDDSLPQKSGVSGSFMSLSTGPLTPESLSTGPVDDTSMSVTSQPASDSFAFKYVGGQSGRDDIIGARRPVNASGSFKSSWASELSSYTDKQRSGMSFDSKTDGSFKYLKPSSDKSFDSELSSFLQEGKQDSSGKFSNLEFNRGSGSDQSQKLQVDRSYDVLHLRDSSASEYYSLPSGLYGRKDSVDRKTLTDVSERPSSEDMSQYSLPDNYKSSDKFSEMSQHSLSDKTDSRVSVSARSPSDLRSSEVSGVTLPSGKGSSDIPSSINMSDKQSSLFTENLSQMSGSLDTVPYNLTEKYSDLSQYTVSEKPDKSERISVSDHQTNAAELSQYTMFSEGLSPSKDLPARQSPIGDFDISSSSAGKGKGDNEDYAESTTTWSEDATTPSSSHKNYRIEKPGVSIEQRDKLRDEIADFSSKQTSTSVEKPTFGRKLDFTSSTPFISDRVPTTTKFSDLSQYTISPDSSEKTESTTVSDRQSLPFQSFAPSHMDNTDFQSLAEDKAVSAYSVKSDTPSVSELRREALSRLSSSSAAPGSLSQYTLNTSGFITKTPLSQYTIPSDTSLNKEPSLSQHTLHTNEDPSLTQYEIQSDLDPSLSQYTISSDNNKQREDLSLTQYSLDKTENNITHDATANMSNGKGISSLSQYSITSEEDDSFVQKKFANLDQLILESRNLIEKHKELVSKNRELEDKERSRGSTPEKRPRTMDFQDGYMGQIPELNSMEQSARTSIPSTIQFDTAAGQPGLSFQSAGLSNYSSKSKLPETSMFTGANSKISDVSAYSADESKEQETGITDEPDLTLVTVSSEVSMVEDVSQVSSGASEHGESVLSFEKHEQSLADEDSPRDDAFDRKKDLNLQEAFMLHKQRFMNAASEIRSRSFDESSSQHDAGESDIFRAVPVMVSPTVSLSMQFNSSQELKFNKPPVSWTKDEEMTADKPSEKEQVSTKPAGKTKVPPPVPKKPQRPVPTEKPKSLNKALQPRKSEPKKHAVVSPEKPGAISLGDLISSTKDLGPHSLKKTEVRKPVLSPRSFHSSSMKTSKPTVGTVDRNEASKKPAATGGALSKTLSSWKKSRAVKSTAVPSLPQKSSELPSTGVKVLPKDKPPSMSSEEYESNMRLNRSLEETDTKTKKTTEDKQKQAAANREKVKDFQKKLQENMRKKQQQRKDKK